MEGVLYLCTENIGADQLLQQGHPETDLCLEFQHNVM